ncbi:hypothetical protein FIU86_13820 [Roseovarius sp. THAF9]|nr:hypothetical protein FIU86_13820 [Roseovarius sp. THAF9]
MERTCQVHINNTTPVFRIEIENGVGLYDSGACDKDVLPSRFFDLGEDLFEGGSVGHIYLQSVYVSKRRILWKNKG